MITRTRLALWIGWMTIVLAATTSPTAAGPIPVKVARSGSGFGFVRGGEPYRVRGAGGLSYPETLRAAGGNSFRTWGSDDLGPKLDRAHELGLTVAVGIWLGQPRQGFRYDDRASVQGQFDRARADIRRYRDHPAVLLWGLGNEMEGDGNDPAIWKAVNDLARMAHEEDPHHPTMTVVAEVGGHKIENFAKLCPDVDILGINSYAGLETVPKRLEAARFDRPWIVTEFGPPGAWEVAKTPWGAPIEPHSSAKAEIYRANLQATADPHCLGSYAFYWGNKQEATATWFGLFLPSGESLGAVDELTHDWTGRWPANRAPRIIKFESAASGQKVTPGSPWKTEVIADDPDGDPITYRWEVRSESNDRREGGDREAEPPAHPESFVEARGGVFQFKAPSREGAYRIFVYLYDGKGHAATGNLLFEVVPKG